MARDSYGHYTATALLPDTRFGSTTPGVELCESVVPHVGRGIMPAPWLPIKRYDNWVKSGVVMSVGIAVGFDLNQYLVPAGIKTGDSVTYSAYDVDMGVIDVTTGEKVTAALTRTIPVDVVPTSGAIPVGVASYNIYQHLGGVTWDNATKIYSVDNDNPFNYRLHNTTKEDLVAFTCDYVIEVPWVGVTEPTGLSTTALSYAHAYGAFTVGGFVKVDGKGCFIPCSSGRSDNLWIGQCLGTKSYVVNGQPLDALNRVKTAYAGSSRVDWQMPGSATAGIPRSIHLATDGAYAANSSYGTAGYTSLIINVQL